MCQNTFISHICVRENPTDISITRGTLSVAILVVVSDGVDIWVALRFSYH